jgi:hypothetical protein
LALLMASLEDHRVRVATDMIDNEWNLLGALDMVQDLETMQ